MDLSRETILDMIGAGRGSGAGVYVPLAFVRWLGSYEAAVLLAQILYWRDVARKRGQATFYHSYNEWRTELALTERQVRNGLEAVRTVGVSTEARRAPNGDRTLFYTVDATALIAAFQAFLSDGSVQNVPTGADETTGPHRDEMYGRLYTDTTAKTTAERDDAPARPQGPYPATPVSGDLSTDPDWDNVGHATPKGTPIQLRPDRPAVHAVPKPGDDPALDADWATLVATFPHRDGAGKVHRPKDTRLAWTLAGPGRRAQILTGARHLATGSKDAQEGFGPHLLDFIQQETYTLWQTPATPRPARSHTDPTRPPAPTYRILNAPAASA